MVKKSKSSKNLIEILRDEFHDYLNRGGVVTALQGAFDSLHSMPPRQRPTDVIKYVAEYIKNTNSGTSPQDRMIQGELDKLGELERLLLILRQHLRLVLAAMAPHKYMGILRGEGIPLGPSPEEDDKETTNEYIDEEEESDEEEEDKDIDKKESVITNTSRKSEVSGKIKKGKKKLNGSGLRFNK